MPSLLRILLLLPLLSGCQFVRDANVFQGRGRIDLTFPFDLIPGARSVLPHIVLDLSGGFEWHNDQVMHEHELAKLRLLKELEAKNEEDFAALFYRALHDPPAQ